MLLQKVVFFPLFSLKLGTTDLMQMYASLQQTPVTCSLKHLCHSYLKTDIFKKLSFTCFLHVNTSPRYSKLQSPYMMRYYFWGNSAINMNHNVWSKNLPGQITDELCYLWSIIEKSTSNRKTNISITHPYDWWSHTKRTETVFFLHLSKLVFYNHQHVLHSEEQAGSKRCTRLHLYPYL